MPGTTKSYLGNLRSLAVGKTSLQSEGTAWLIAALERIHGRESRPATSAAALYRRLLGAGAIGARQTCVTDTASMEPGEWSLFRADNEQGWYRPTLQQRMQIFQDVARAVALAAYPAADPAPAHLLQVSCTGYEAPTAVQRLVAQRQWGESTRVLHLGHMGCFAAIPACATAALLAAALGPGGGFVSVLHVELCTLHMDLATVDPEQVVVQYLFADGAIRYDLQAAPPVAPSFAVLDTFEVILPDSAEAMTWGLTSDGFRMTLERDVPRLVVQTLPGLVARLLGRHGLSASDVSRWAIHPGGSKIIEGVATCLEVADPAMIAHSIGVFRARGNMSSATLPHVWQALLADPAVAVGETIVSLAFGPGLTVTGNLLRKCGPHAAAT